MTFFDFHIFTFIIEPDSNKEIYVAGTCTLTVLVASQTLMQLIATLIPFKPNGSKDYYEFEV